MFRNIARFETQNMHLAKMFLIKQKIAIYLIYSTYIRSLVQKHVIYNVENISISFKMIFLEDVLQIFYDSIYENSYLLMCFDSNQ